MPLSLLSQEIIVFKNPSFEAQLLEANSNYSAQDIDSWEDCSQTLFIGETPFDVQPGFWGVSLKPKHGSSYIGLITRKNETYESIGQRIQNRLKRGVEYSLSLHIATSYKSKSPSSETQKGYKSSNSKENPYAVSSPAILRVRLTNSITKKTELIYTSNPILNNKWGILDIKFTPRFDADYIIFEAYFPNSNEPTYGNILIDAINMDIKDSEKIEVDNTNTIDIDKTNNLDFEKYGFRDIERRIKTLANYQLIDLINGKIKCSRKSEILRSIASVCNLGYNRDNLNSFLRSLTEDEKEEIWINLEKVKAFAHINALKGEIDYNKLITNYNKVESEQSLHGILIKYISLNRETIIKEILLCY